MLKYTVDGYYHMADIAVFTYHILFSQVRSADIISRGFKNQKRKCGKYA